MYSGVFPSVIALSLSAPAFNNTSTTSLWPDALAINSGVRVCLSVLSLSAPAFNNTFTTSS